MSRELEFSSSDPDFAIKFAWSLHEVLGCPLRAAAHGPDGWCSRQEHLVGIASNLRESTLAHQRQSVNPLTVEGQTVMWEEAP